MNVKFYLSHDIKITYKHIFAWKCQDFAIFYAMLEWTSLHNIINM